MNRKLNENWKTIHKKHGNLDKKNKILKIQKYTVIELKNSLKSLNSKLNQTEERVRKPEDRTYSYPIEGQNE